MCGRSRARVCVCNPLSKKMIEHIFMICFTVTYGHVVGPSRIKLRRVQMCRCVNIVVIYEVSLIKQLRTFVKIIEKIDFDQYMWITCKCEYLAIVCGAEEFSPKLNNKRSKIDHKICSF